MNLYHPSLPPMHQDQLDAPVIAMNHGRDLALADLAAHPDRTAEIYARAAASYVHAAITPNARQHLLEAMKRHATMGDVARSVTDETVAHKRLLDAQRDAIGADRAFWACCMIDIGVGIAQVADGLFRADGADRGVVGASAQEFLYGYAAPIPEHGRIGAAAAVTRPVLETSPGAATAAPVTAGQLIDRWLDSKGCLSDTERSRRGSSARLFLTAARIGVDDDVRHFAGVGPRVASGYASLSEAVGSKWGTVAARHAGRTAEEIIAIATTPPIPAWAQHRLEPRGRKARIAHVIDLLVFVRGVGIAVPNLDWTAAKSAIEP